MLEKKSISVISFLVRIRSKMLFWRVGWSTNCERKRLSINQINMFLEVDSAVLFVASLFTQLIPGKLKSPVSNVVGWVGQLLTVSLRNLRTSLNYSEVDIG